MPKYFLTDSDIAELKDLLAWRDSFKIAGASRSVSTARKASISIGKKKEAITFNERAWVKPGAILMHLGDKLYGKYEGTYWDSPTTAPDLTTPISGADFGTAGIACYVYNAAEIGWDGGDDDVGQLEGTDKIFPADFLMFAADGKRIMAINGFDPTVDCQDVG